MIAAKNGIKYNEALKVLKATIAKAIGKPYVKPADGGSITWMQALEKTKAYLKWTNKSK